MLKAIDVSSHQGVFNWEVAKNYIDFAILRSSHGMIEKDDQFERNYSECKRLGIPVGVYHFFYWKDQISHNTEIENFLKTIKGKTFEYPAFIDYEYYKIANTNTMGWASVKTITDYALSDISKLRTAGFKTGVYANKNWFTNKIDTTKFDDDVMIWLAQYDVVKPTYTGHYDIWQYTSKINGVPWYSGRLDLNYYYPPVNQGVVLPAKLGEKSSRVFVIQKFLLSKDYKITLDGVFGKQTDAVIRQFQSDYGLKVDGIVGVVTMKKLDSIKKYSVSKDGETYITKNIKVKELACKDGSDEVIIDLNVVERAQVLRDEIGKPIHFNSAYRTKSWNTLQGGEDNSYHMKGMALDFYFDGISPHSMYDKMNKYYIGGLGRYKSFTHMDTGKKRRWIIS